MAPPLSTSYPLTSTLVHHLLTTHSTSRSPPKVESHSNASGPPQAPHPATLALGISELHVQEGASLSSYNPRRKEKPARGHSSGTITTDETNNDAPMFHETAAEESEQVIVSDILANDSSIDEEDKPDALKALLTSILVCYESETLDLDPLILSLLHRYHEDLHPSLNPVPPLPNHFSNTPTRPVVPRSPSFRRQFSAASIGKSVIRSAATAMSTSTGPSSSAASIASSSSLSSAPTSPLRSASPSLRIQDNGSSSHGGTPSHSPWSSPRVAPLKLALSAAAVEFKFSASTADFIPGGGGANLPLISRSPAGSSPGTPLRSKSPMLTNPYAAQAAWAAHNSPLGTPKTGLPGSGMISAPGSRSNSPSFFPRHLDAGSHYDLQHGHTGPKPMIARLPWADANDSSGGSQGAEDAETEDDEEDVEDLVEQGGGIRLRANNLSVEGIGTDIGYSGGPLWGNGSLLAAKLPYNHYSLPVDQLSQSQEEEAGVHAGAWDPFERQQEEFPEGHMPDDSRIFHYDTDYERASIEFANSITGPTGLGGMGAYSMTPFDVLHSVFAESNVSATILEEALVMSGWDVDRAMEYIIGLQPGDATSIQSSLSQSHTPSATGSTGVHLSTSPQLQNAANGGTGSRPVIISRDSYENRINRTQTPTSGDHSNGAGGNAAGGRVCRYYLTGNCLRSDCKFSHDVGKAVCKFWLRGHCLKGDGRCDFLHSIPPIMKADLEQRAQHRSQSINQSEEELGPDEGPELDFPTLGEAPRARHQLGQSGRNVILDPARNRFSGAVKFGSAITSPVPTLPRSTVAAQASTRDSRPSPRHSARLSLRPPGLLPTLPTGPVLAALYARYRSSFLELGANRNKCLAKAAECWKRGDGAGARKFSREAQDWNRQVAIEGRDSAKCIVEERKKALKKALLSNVARPGAADDVNDRRVRGHEKGYGIVLGVVSQSMLSRAERHLTPEERTEVALDLHGLHSDEAVSFLGDFLLSLERDRFLGLAYIVIGQAKHTGSSDAERGAAAGRLRLEQACTEFLSEQGWPWVGKGGIICVDALR